MGKSDAVSDLPGPESVGSLRVFLSAALSKSRTCFSRRFRAPQIEETVFVGSLALAATDGAKRGSARPYY